MVCDGQRSVVDIKASTLLWEVLHHAEENVLIAI